MRGTEASPFGRSNGVKIAGSRGTTTVAGSSLPSVAGSVHTHNKSATPDLVALPNVRPPRHLRGWSDPVTYRRGSSRDLHPRKNRHRLRRPCRPRRCEGSVDGQQPHATPPIQSRLDHAPERSEQNRARWL